VRGSKPVVKYLHKRKERFCVLGALSADDFFYQITEENLNSQIFEQFIKSLIEKFNQKSPNITIFARIESEKTREMLDTGVGPEKQL
jgi:hypothetical protein